MVGKECVVINQAVDACSMGGEIEPLVLFIKLHVSYGNRKVFLLAFQISNILDLGKSPGNICSEEHY